MAVYVDDLFFWPPTNELWCHMMADSDAELEAFAHRLRLKPQWKHGDHYDLTPGKRRQAVAIGAIEIDRETMVNIRAKLRQQAHD